MSDMLRELHRELQQHQRRLGTAAEQPEDFKRVLEIAHAMSNHLTALLMTEALESGAEPSLRSTYAKHVQ